jgi:hypothetical protein
MAEDTKWVTEAGGLAFDADINRVGRSAGLPPRGVFGKFPGATPKYALNDGTGEQSDFREQMARMFIQVKNYKNFVDSFDKNSGSKRIAEVIGGTVSADGLTNPNEGNGYIDFLLQTVQHGFQEKHQVVETLADDHVAYFFGQAAPMFTYGGTLINTKQDDQAMNMLRLYRDMGRGGKLAQLNTLLSIRYDGLIVSGAMMNLSWTLSADSETAVPFNFTLLVKQVVQLPNKYGALVTLEKPFTTVEATGGRYRPFESGLGNLNTSSVKVTGVPPVASSLAPAATPAAPTTSSPNAIKVVNQLNQTVTPKTDAELAADAAREARQLSSTGREIGGGV